MLLTEKHGKSSGITGMKSIYLYITEWIYATG